MGKKIRFGRGEWEDRRRHGLPAAARQDSEIWGDVNQVSADFQRVEVLSSAMVRATDAVAAKALINDINNDQRLNMNAAVGEGILRPADRVRRAHRVHRNLRVDHHGGGQQLRRHEYDVRGGGAPLARNRHAARARVFAWQHPGQLLSGIVLLALLGGCSGCLLVLPLNGITTGIGNANFAETAFDFQVTPQIMLVGIAFAVVLGRVGGLVPGAQCVAKRDPDGAAGNLESLWTPNSRI